MLRLPTMNPSPFPRPPPSLLLQVVVLGATAAQPYLAAPFDALRRHYAGAVLAGLVPRSLRASARLEQCLDALESLTLGPLARQR